MDDYGKKPDFKSWDHTTLARLAHDLWDDNIKLREANEQLRLDNRDRSEELRKFLRETP